MKNVGKLRPIHPLKGLVSVLVLGIGALYSAYLLRDMPLEPSVRYDIPYGHVFLLSLLGTVVALGSLTGLVTYAICCIRGRAYDPQSSDGNIWTRAGGLILYMAAGIGVFALIMGYI